MRGDIGFLRNGTDDVRHHPPDGKVALFGDFRRGVGGIGGNEIELSVRSPDALHGKLAVEDGHDDGVVFYLQGAVDDEHVAGEDPGVPHGVAFHPHEKRSGRVADELFVKVDLPVQEIIGRAREPRGHLREVQRNFVLRALPKGGDDGDFHMGCGGHGFSRRRRLSGLFHTPLGLAREEE